MNAATLFEEPEAAIAHRQSQLRIPLSAAAARCAAARDVATGDASRLAQMAGLAAVRWVFDPAELAELTGQPTPSSIWGWSERAVTPPIVYVDLAQCRSRGVALGVLAHELTHLTHYGRRYSGHRDAWWVALQQLLDRAA
jgi:hypothetical protein